MHECFECICITVILYLLLPTFRMTWKIEGPTILNMFLWPVESCNLQIRLAPVWGFEVRCLGRCH